MDTYQKCIKLNMTLIVKFYEYIVSVCLLSKASTGSA